MRAVLIAALLLSAAPAMADSVKGTILAFHQVARVIVFIDRSVRAIGAVEVLDNLEPNDVVTIDDTSAGDNGIRRASRIVREE